MQATWTEGNDFAEHVKLQPETLSRIENGKQSVGENTDVHIRIYYALESKDPVLMDTLRSALVEPLRPEGARILRLRLCLKAHYVV